MKLLRLSVLLVCILPCGILAQITGKVTTVNGEPLSGALVYAVSGPGLEALAEKYEPPRWRIDRGVLTPKMYIVRPHSSLKLFSNDETGYNVMVSFKQGTTRNNTLFPKRETTFVSGKPELFARVSEDLGRVWGHVCVLEYPVYGITDAAGLYAITNLSSGVYTLETAHPKLGKVRGEITVQESKISTNNFFLP